MAASQIIKTMIAMEVIKERTKAAVVQKGMTIRKAEIAVAVVKVVLMATTSHRS
jgi:hypothetical protein